METNRGKLPPKVKPDPIITEPPAVETHTDIGYQRPQEFGDFDKRAEALELDTLIKGAILKLQGYYKQYLGPMRAKLIQFIEIMKVLPDEPNQYRLPYFQLKIPYSATARRSECVLAVVSALIEAWWDYQRETAGAKAAVEHSCYYLLELSMTNIVRERIYDDLQKGYYLWKNPLETSGNESSVQPTSPSNA